MSAQIEFLKRCKALGLHNSKLPAWLDEIESLRAQVAELKAENERLKREDFSHERVQNDSYKLANKVIQDERDELKRQSKVLRDALNEINNWLVCACIASAEDMAQSFADMQQLADTALDTTKENEDGL